MERDRLEILPSRSFLTYPYISHQVLKSKFILHLQTAFWMGYVSFQEGIPFGQNHDPFWVRMVGLRKVKLICMFLCSSYRTTCSIFVWILGRKRFFLRGCDSWPAYKRFSFHVFSRCKQGSINDDGWILCFFLVETRLTRHGWISFCSTYGSHSSTWMVDKWCIHIFAKKKSE